MGSQDCNSCSRTPPENCCGCVESHWFPRIPTFESNFSDEAFFLYFAEEIPQQLGRNNKENNQRDEDQEYEQ